MFPLSGKLINEKQSYEWLIESAKNEKEEFNLCSAFLRSSILQSLSDVLSPEVKVNIIARWQFNDLLAGASDFKSYEIARSLGWKFFIKLNFHGKVYSFANRGILVGSANATNSGLGLSAEPNSEVCTVVDLNEDNEKLISSLFENSTELNDELFHKMVAVSQIEVPLAANTDWPDDILDQLTLLDMSEQRLLMSECFMTDGKAILGLESTSPESHLDLSLLSLPLNFELRDVIKEFRSSRIFRWLLAQLEESKELYFGTVTASLHDALLQDPAPHRKEVKSLVQNLFSWIELLGPESTGLLVDRPNYSQRISIASHL